MNFKTTQMAEIKIEKKKSIWLWILGILAILAILYFVFLRNDDNAINDMKSDNIEMVTVDVENDTMLSEQAVSAIIAYETYISKEPEMGLEHEFSHAALDKLIEATEAVAGSLNVDIKADIDAARTDADFITKDVSNLNHADKIKDAGTIITRALKNVQTEKFPDMVEGLADLQQSVNAIAPGTETLEQKAAVKNFFKEAALLLTQMKNK